MVALAGTGDQHEPGTRLLGRGRRRQAADAAAEHGHDVAGLRVRDRDAPPDACPERVERHRHLGRQRVGHRQQQRVGRQVLVGGIATPQPGRPVGAGHAVHVWEPVALAAPVLAPPAGGAGAARQEHLDGDTVARPDAPALGRPVADRLDHPDRLVTRHEREAGRDRAGVELVVGAAEAARLDPQDAVLVADLGQRQLVAPQRPGRLQHERVDGPPATHRGSTIVSVPWAAQASRPWK
jgi:hypothetical protein